MSEKDGGPAFPVNGQTVPGGEPLALAGQLAHGMSLRDYFAAKALPSIMADSRCTSYDMAAEGAYKQADAMLKARGGK